MTLSATAFALGVNQSGYDLFTTAALAPDQDLAIGPCRADNLFPQRARGGADADELDGLDNCWGSHGRAKSTQ